MMWSAQRTLLKLVILVWWAILPSTAYGQDVELTEVAQGLLGKLEAAKQTSGTVLDFSDLQGSPTELGRYLAQELSDRMVSENSGFGLVDRANLQYLLRENKLSAEGLVNPKTTRKLGQLIGIDTVILGTTTPLGDSIRLSVRAIDVETGKIVASQTATLPATTGLRTLYNRGVASEHGSQSRARSSSELSLRELMRPGALEVSIKDFAMTRKGQVVGMSFSLQNLSGSDLQVKLDSYGSKIGLCDFDGSVRATGIYVLGMYESAGIESTRYEGTWIRAGQQIQASVTNLGYCRSGTVSLKSTNELALSFIAVRDEEEFKLVVTVPEVSIRQVSY